MSPAAAAPQRLLFLPSVCSFARSQKSVYHTAGLGQPSQASVLRQFEPQAPGGEGLLFVFLSFFSRVLHLASNHPASTTLVFASGEEGSGERVGFGCSVAFSPCGEF